MTPQRITLVTSSLTCGGAEKNVALLANEWSGRGKTVTVISFDRHPPFFQLLQAVTLLKLDITRGYRNPLFDLWTAPARLIRLRRAIIASHPDVVVSFMDLNNLLTLLTTRGLEFPVIVAERSDPRIWPMQTGWRILRRLLYPLANRVLTQTEASRRFFSTSLQRKTVVIPNPILPFALELRLPHKLSAKRILSTGRLIDIKRFDLLLRAFSAVHSEFPDWSLDIVGDGEERERLEALARELQITPSVHFHGLVSDTASPLQNASIFALCSDFEGFPNALAEAIAAGVPAITTESHGGRELVQDGVNGLVVPVRELDRLTAALRRLMGDAGLRERMSTAALTHSRQFSLENVLLKWDEVFNTL